MQINNTQLKKAVALLNTATKTFSFLEDEEYLYQIKITQIDRLLILTLKGKNGGMVSTTVDIYSGGIENFVVELGELKKLAKFITRKENNIIIENNVLLARSGDKNCQIELTDTNKYEEYLSTYYDDEYLYTNKVLATMSIEKDNSDNFIKPLSGMVPLNSDYHSDFGRIFIDGDTAASTDKERIHTFKFNSFKFKGVKIELFFNQDVCKLIHLFEGERFDITLEREKSRLDKLFERKKSGIRICISNKNKKISLLDYMGCMSTSNIKTVTRLIASRSEDNNLTQFTLSKDVLEVLKSVLPFANKDTCKINLLSKGRQLFARYGDATVLLGCSDRDSQCNIPINCKHLIDAVAPITGEVTLNHDKNRSYIVITGGVSTNLVSSLKWY